MAEDRARYDLQIYKGADYLKNATFKIDNKAIDFTGYTAKAQIRKSLNSETLVAEFTCEIDALNGKIILSLTAEQTAALTPGFYEWDLQLTDYGGTVFYYIYGKCVVSGRVTI